MLITPRVPYLSSSDHSSVFASDPIDRWHRVDRINLGIIRAIRRKEVARSLGEIPVFDWPEITDRQHRELSSHPITSRHDEYPEVAHANDGPVPVIAGKRERERRSTKISLDLRRCCTRLKVIRAMQQMIIQAATFQLKAPYPMVRPIHLHESRSSY